MRIRTRQVLQFLGWVIFGCIATLSSGTFLSRHIPKIVSHLLPLLSLLFLALSNKLKIKKYCPQYYLPWFILIVFMLVGSALLKFDNLAISLDRIACILISIALMKDTHWFGLVRKILLVFTGLFVVFTWFFFIFRPAYSVMLDLNNFVPVGVSGWQNGYHAGLANHYSSNGIYVSICLILLISWYLAWRGNVKKKHFRMTLLVLSILLTFGALLLTEKRGVLLWSLGAVILTSLVLSDRKLGEIIRLAVVGLFGLLVLSFILPKVPELGAVYERFSTVGTDVGSLERIYMWQLAVSMFLQHPVLGTGFWSFRHQYERSIFGIFNQDTTLSQLDAHNVYLQILGETGIIGFIIYIWAISGLLFDTIKLARHLREYPDPEVRFGIQFSLCIQFFYLLYSLSGNCLYDIVFYFYAVAMAITTALKYHMRGNYVITQAERGLSCAQNLHSDIPPSM